MSPRHVNNSYIPTSIATVNQNMSIHSMADMRQRLPNEIGPITFRLKMVQEPKRMLGIGDKPNRGRIHPQPIVQLELEKRFGQDVTYPLLEFMSCFVVAMLLHSYVIDQLKGRYYLLCRAPLVVQFRNTTDFTFNAAVVDNTVSRLWNAFRELRSRNTQGLPTTAISFSPK